ncbi:MAG: hypothetical protein ABI377_06040, partial [Devosia sp.]
QSGYFFIIDISSQAILPSAIFMSCIIIFPSFPIIMIMQPVIGVADFIIASSWAAMSPVIGGIIMVVPSGFMAPGAIVMVWPDIIASAAKAGTEDRTNKPTSPITV